MFIYLSRIENYTFKTKLPKVRLIDLILSDIYASYELFWNNRIRIIDLIEKKLAEYKEHFDKIEEHFNKEKWEF